MMQAYIRGVGNISPQNTLDCDGFLDEIALHKGKCKCIEPNYKDYIDLKLLRRMSRLIKMGATAAKICLADARVELPNAIIAGTGLGCIEDTEKFLTSIIENDERLLNPAPFIQSTHNTISSQIAIILGCNSYNATYVHRGASFESALIDATMLLDEGESENVLLGGFDELTDGSYSIMKRLGVFKREDADCMGLLNSDTLGAVAGEGAAFFLLASKPSGRDYAKISAVTTIYNPADDTEVQARIVDFLRRDGLESGDIDLALLGISGDARYDGMYHKLMNGVFAGSVCAYYKHLCGDYHTATAFSLWLCAKILKEKLIPKVIRINDAKRDNIKNVLIYNNYKNKYHSMILVRDV